MTTQQRDTVHVDGKPLVLTGSTHRLFDPAAHGLRLEALLSSCWRGHVCEYRLGDDGRLTLTRLTVYVAEPEHATPVAGCHPQPARGHLDCEYRYDGLSLPLPPFDGTLIVGDWPYGELIFLDGKLVRRRRRWSMPAELSAV